MRQGLDSKSGARACRRRPAGGPGLKGQAVRARKWPAAKWPAAGCARSGARWRQDDVPVRVHSLIVTAPGSVSAPGAGRRVSAAGARDDTGRNPGPLAGIAPRFHLVAAAVREPPDEESWFGLVQPPALGLFGLVMPSAQTGEITLAGPSALVVRDRVVLVAACRRTTAAGEPTGALTDVDQVPQRRSWPIPRGLALVKALAGR